MSIHPRQVKDLTLAPVAALVDLNLQRMRDHTPQQVEAELELELDTPATRVDREARAQLVLRQALRGVDTHGWRASISDDDSRLHLDGGSVSLDLGLGAGVTEYIQVGI